MTAFPALTWSNRLTAIRKLATRAKTYLLIAIKPDDMLKPRGEDYVIAPVAAALGAAEDEIERLLAALAPRFEPARRALGGLLDNSYFAGGDALAAYTMIQHVRPRRVIEIGSGSSTRIMRQAARDAGLELHLRCVDPAPRREIDDVADEILRRSVLDAGADLADGLEDGDILFIDGSHYAFNGTDVPFLYLEVLPRLKPGVIVHVHDIMLPFEYDALFTRRNYNEQYIVAALLLDRAAWQPLLPVYWLARQGRMPAGQSLWMRRRATADRG